MQAVASGQNARVTDSRGAPLLDGTQQPCSRAPRRLLIAEPKRKIRRAELTSNLQGFLRMAKRKIDWGYIRRLEWQVIRDAEDDGGYDGWVYFIRVGTTGPVKIGYTADRNITKRLTELQVGCPYKLSVVAFVRGSRATERALHRLFAHGRMQGEWFSPRKSRGLTDFIVHLGQLTLVEAA